jgi:tetratricopeptide (TPR) repeat protein
MGRGKFTRNKCQRWLEIQGALQVSEIDPTLISAQVNWGLVLLDQKQYGEAIARFERVIARNPNLADAYFFLGHAYMGLHRRNEAQKAFQNYLKLEPTGSHSKGARQILKDNAMSR